MQFHLNGFEPGDPEISDPAERMPLPDVTGAVPEEVDVLIVGCGPAGLTLAAQLSAFPDIKTCIVEQKPGPLLLGQADGIACRTMEMFEAFGFSERVLKEACWINETTFWKPDDEQREQHRPQRRVQDVEDGLSEFPHVVLNQARVHDFYLDVMRKSPTQARAALCAALARSCRSIRRPTRRRCPSRVTVTARTRSIPRTKGRSRPSRRATWSAATARAAPCASRSGATLHGDSANHAWGVMDVLAVTDFPDIRFKSLIQSAHDGSILIIPREGGYLVRLYVELDKLDADERVARPQHHGSTI